MKVAIFEGGVRAREFGDRRIPSLEEQINDFIKGKKVIDIKHQMALDNLEFNTAVMTVLVMYEEHFRGEKDCQW